MVDQTSLGGRRRSDARSRGVAGRPLKKSGEARSAAEHAAPGAQDLVAQRTPRVRHPGRQPQDAALPLGEDGRSGASPAHQRHRSESDSVRIQSDHRAASSRGLGGQRQAGTADLSSYREDIALRRSVPSFACASACECAVLTPARGRDRHCHTSRLLRRPAP